VARAEAIRLHELGFTNASLVWAVRAAEILLRDFVLTPHFLELGESWDRAMKSGAHVLGDGNWKQAFTKANEWYGPFDEPLTTDEENAWKAWDRVVRRRGDIVHGRAVVDVTQDEAKAALDFGERMASWYAQRFLTTERHPIGRQFKATLDTLISHSRGGMDDNANR
jgi:hypothetical protein